MRVLVSSLSRSFGGVESLFLGLVEADSNDSSSMDFVCTDSSAAREEDFLAVDSRVFHICRPYRHLREYYKEFCKIFQAGNYDIYHVNLTRFRFPLDVLIARRCGIKVVLHCHSTKIYDVGSIKIRLIRSLEQILFKPLFLLCSDLNIACSKNAGHFLFKKHPYIILYNGIDISRFRYDEEKRNQVRKEFGLLGKKVIGHIGRFSYEKNHTYMLDILEILIKTGSNYSLLCVGDGDLLGNIKEKAKEKGLAGYMVITGLRTDIPSLLSAMDVFLFPSIHEALPITLIEAQANGLPCVISDCVTNEIDVLDTIRRLSVDDGADVWAETIEQSIEENRKFNDKFSVGDFEIGRMKDKLNEIYLRLLG